jgi:hypothetical protein
MILPWVKHFGELHDVQAYPDRGRRQGLSSLGLRLRRQPATPTMCRPSLVLGRPLVGQAFSLTILSNKRRCANVTTCGRNGKVTLNLTAILGRSKISTIGVGENLL